MTSAILPFGTENALTLRADSSSVADVTHKITTVLELLSKLDHLQSKTQSMLRTTAALFATYLNVSTEELVLDDVYSAKAGFGQFLRGRKYQKNSVRSYVNYGRILLTEARRMGWTPNASVPENWQPVITQAAARNCEDLARDLSRKRNTPRQVTLEDVDSWATAKLAEGYAFDGLRRKKMRFWRLLRDTDCTDQTPNCLIREERYGIDLNDFPPSLKKETKELLRWKQAPFSIDRPQDEQLRPVSAKILQETISALYGFAVNVRGESGIESLSDLMQKSLVGAFAEWCLNERRVAGRTLQRRLSSIGAALRHPSYRSLDLSWYRPLIESIPIDPASEARKRKAEKFLEYPIVESIPGMIRAVRPEAAKKGEEYLARVVMHELLMSWLAVLPWRQRNIRECRVGGSNPNLFKAKIPPFSDIDKPNWVREAEKSNPEQVFWQFRFSPQETKMNKEIHALIPRQLIGLLEEYLFKFRSCLLTAPDPGTLFINPNGGSMDVGQMTFAVGQLTVKHGGKRVTPHSFRDIVAYAWLKDHPQDYLTLSKLLWHSNINPTLQIYGSRFNESSGVSAMERWLDEREARSK